MIEISQTQRRKAFSTWLRTGRLPSSGANAVELKFNPWHDPDTGRFTFAGTGRNYGQWGDGADGDTASVPRPFQTRQAGPARHAGSSIPAHIDPVRKPAAPSRLLPDETRRRGGSFGGGGASGTWGAPEPQRPPSKRPPSTPPIVSTDRVSSAPRPIVARTAKTKPEQYRKVIRNGYTYQIDSRNRTRHVSGTLTTATVATRSRTAQARAGGAERRSSDDGGHYIAARFNGPTEAFNHFAQDANFNRGRFRLLEDEWARDRRAGRVVKVNITPIYQGAAIRPSEIDVVWTVDNRRKSMKFANEQLGRPYGTR